MDNLMHAEASRLVSVLDEALNKFSLLRLVAPGCEDVLEGDGTNAVGRHKRLVDAIIQLWKWEEKYESAVKRRASKDKVDTSATRLRETLRIVYRALREDGDAVCRLQEYRKRETETGLDDDARTANGRGGVGEEGSMAQFTACFRGLRAKTIESLSRTAEQAHSNDAFIEEVKVRTKTLMQELEILERECQEQKQKRKREVAQHDDIVSRLRADLRGIKHAAELEARELERETKEMEESHIKSFEEARALGDSALEAKHHEYEKTLRECNEKEDLLRKKTNKARNELDGWIQRFDADIQAKQDEYDAIQAKYSAESEQLYELEEYFRKVDRDLANEMEEERLIAKEQARLDAIQARIERAATRIQAVYRGIISRKRSRKKGKKKKSKKSKGKKK